MTSLAAPTTRQLSVWVNGRLFDDPAAAQVPVTDHGLVVGDGVFEALKVTPAGPFAIQRHLNRMTRSAAALGLPAPDHGLVREGIAATLSGWSEPEGKIRITYTGGEGPLGSQAAFGPTTLIVAVQPRDPSPPTTRIVTAPWRRNEHGALTGVKSTSYAENVRGLAYARARGASEAIFRNTAGSVCEGTGTNVFCVFDGMVITPPLSAGCLAGITREVLLEWTEIVERDLTPEQAHAADEVFITSSLRDVQGVEEWDGTRFVGLGPITQRIAEVFAERSAALVDP